MSDTSEVSTREHMLTQFMDTFQPCATALLEPHPGNPRRDCDDAALDELAASIRAVGLIEPLIVVRIEGEGRRYQVVAGHRRLEAAKRAGLEIVPCLIKTLTPPQQLEVMLVENLQRRDLRPLEEAEAYRRLLADCGYTQEALAGRIGISQAQVANRLRLLRLPEAIRDDISREIITPTHALALLKLVPEGRPPSPFLSTALTELKDRPAREAGEHVELAIWNYGRSLAPRTSRWENPPLFDVTECHSASCPYICQASHRYRNSGAVRTHCINPACWDRKQRPLAKAAEAAKKAKAREAAKQATAAAAPAAAKPEKSWPKQPPQSPSILSADSREAFDLYQIGQGQYFANLPPSLTSEVAYRFTTYLPFKDLLAHFADRASFGASQMPDGMGYCGVGILEAGVRLYGRLPTASIQLLTPAPEVEFAGSRYGRGNGTLEVLTLAMRQPWGHISDTLPSSCTAEVIDQVRLGQMVVFELTVRPDDVGGHYALEQLLVVHTRQRHIVIRGGGHAVMRRDLLPKFLALCAALPAHPTAEGSSHAA